MEELVGSRGSPGQRDYCLLVLSDRWLGGGHSTTTDYQLKFNRKSKEAVETTSKEPGYKDSFSLQWPSFDSSDLDVIVGIR